MRVKVYVVLTDPPYLANYLSRDGRSVLNDSTSDWVPHSLVLERSVQLRVRWPPARSEL